MTALFALFALAVAAIAGLAAPTVLQERWYFPSSVDLLSVTIQDLQAYLSNGTITSVQLTQRYLVSRMIALS